MVYAVLLVFLALFARARAQKLAAQRTALLLRAVVDGTTDAVFAKDAGGRYLLFNEAAARFVGWPVASVLGRDDTALFEPASARRVRERDVAVMESGVASTHEEVLTADGVTRAYLVCKSPLRDAEGRVIGVVGISRDITERKRAAELEHSMGEAWFQLDADWRFTAANERCHSLLKHTREQMIGHRIWDVFHLLNGTPMEADYRRAMRERVAVSFEALSPIAQRWLEVRLFPSGDGLAAFLLDIDERKRAQQALMESEARYRRLVELLPAAMILVTRGRIAYCNPAMVAMIGAPDLSALVGRDPLDVVAPEDRAIVRERIATMLATGQAAPVRQGRMLRFDGRPVPVTVVAAPIVLDGEKSMMVVFSDLTERERSMELLASVLESVPDAIFTASDRRVIESASAAAGRVFGCPAAGLVGRQVETLLPALAGAPWPDAARELEGVRIDGTRFPAELVVTALASDAERRHTLVVRDITARRRLEDQVRQAQKMDAVGRLAGGVAHDFNNALMVVNGYCEELLADLPAESPQRAPLVAIRTAGERATRLTRQLLAFGRKAMMVPVSLDLAELVRDLARALGRMLGEDVELTVTADAAVDAIRADAGQLEQVILNLALNAREAMPTGGRLDIGVAAVDVAPGAAHPAGLPPGRWVELSVVDTGCGIPPSDISKIFEPFFTTKPFEKGAGMGLAVVHGVVEQCGGRVAVESVVDRGTALRLYFPSSAGPARTTASRDARKTTGTILVVEDEEEVRAFTRMVLESRGYTVLTAVNAAEAEAAAGAAPSLDLVLTDVVLPGPNGRQIAERLRALRPGLKVLYMSGYTDDAVVRHGVVEGRDAFLAKPFTVADLTRRVGELIRG